MNDTKRHPHPGLIPDIPRLPRTILFGYRAGIFTTSHSLFGMVFESHLYGSVGVIIRVGKRLIVALCCNAAAIRPTVCFGLPDQQPVSEHIFGGVLLHPAV
jgi:hypothetical protein